MPSKIRLAPLNVPFERRKQTAVVLFWLMSLPITLFLCCTIPFFWPWIIAYSLFAFFDIAPENVISVGAWTNFATEANDYSKHFPGIICRLLTFSANFNMPLYREYLMAQGVASVSRQSFKERTRSFGFIKLATRCGACLVLVFSFGENDIWEQANNPREDDIRVLPHRRQITTVVGKPIEVKQNANPSDEEVFKV
nr:7311_t:CDS:2 [Entrophospora candida]